mmetsp:Transcript_18509/g.33425  ORF Transcript_18509/g.33425 Transcript_18509/m.33425 type:complete len:100 (+) Transcript_18509:971-1270(+)
MQKSVDLLNELKFELSRSKPSKSPPSKGPRASLTIPGVKPPRRSVSPHEEEFKAERMAAQLLERIKGERERFTEDCDRLKGEIRKLLSKGSEGWIYVEE